MIDAYPATYDPTSGTWSVDAAEADEGEALEQAMALSMGEHYPRDG